MYALDDYHGWFKQSAMRWFDIAQVKAKERIRKAVELDQVLRRFYGEAHAKDSELYSRSSLLTIRNAIDHERYF